MPPAPFITQQGNILTTIRAYYQYNWYNVDSMAVGDSSVLVLSRSGNYYVVVSGSGSICSSSSNLFNSIFTGIKVVNKGQPLLSPFPNPASDFLNINLSGMAPNAELTIKMYDVTGMLILEKVQTTDANIFYTRVSINSISPGLYLLQLHQATININRKISIVR